MLNDKCQFLQYFDKFISRKYYLVDKDIKPEQLKAYVHSFPNERFLIKPVSSSYGRGVHVSEGAEEVLAKNKNGEAFLMEELLENEPTLARLNFSSLNTLRVLTCIDRQQIPHILCVVLRTGCKGAVVDNLFGGGTCYHVDVETGIVDAMGKDLAGNEFLRHPSSSIIMPGFQIPSYNQVVSYAKELAMHLSDARLVGWDIAITPDGLEVIEGNARPSAELIQCTGKGLLKKIEGYY